MTLPVVDSEVVACGEARYAADRQWPEPRADGREEKPEPENAGPRTPLRKPARADDGGMQC